MCVEDVHVHVHAYARVFAFVYEHVYLFISTDVCQRFSRIRFALPGTASQLCTEATTKFSNFASAAPAGLGASPELERNGRRSNGASQRADQVLQRMWYLHDSAWEFVGWAILMSYGHGHEL